MNDLASYCSCVGKDEEVNGQHETRGVCALYTPEVRGPPINTFWQTHRFPDLHGLDKAVEQSGPVSRSIQGMPTTSHRFAKRAKEACCCAWIDTWQAAQGGEKPRSMAMTLTYCVVGDLGRNVGLVSPYCDGRNTQATRTSKGLLMVSAQRLARRCGRRTRVRLRS